MDSSITVINWVQATFGETSRPMFEFFSIWGGPWGWALVILLLFFLAGSKAGLRVAFAITIAMTINTLLKWCIAEPRPYYVSDEIQAMHALGGLGMPSGHAQGVAALWFTFAYSVRQRWCIWLAIIVISLTGASRVYLGVHTHEQVAAGWVLGLVVAMVTARFEPQIIAWFRSKSFQTQVASIVGVTATIILVGGAVAYGVRGDFEAPPDWVSRWQRTTERLAAQGDEKANDVKLDLIHPRLIVGMAALFLSCSISSLRLSGLKETTRENE